jgi:predicted nucleic acid-binding protein
MESVVGQLIIDTSAILAVLLSEPERHALIATTKGATLLAAPSLPWEIGNALVAGARRGRLRAGEVRRVWRAFGRVPIRLLEVDVEAALELALSLRLYAYDGYVLEVARSHRLPLLTLDHVLAEAGGRAGVTVMELPP